MPPASDSSPRSVSGPAPPADPLDVCVVGSANLDLVASATRIPLPGETVLGSAYAEHAGGKGVNQAIAAARSGSSVAFIGSVGADEAGERLIRVLTDDGIDVRGVSIGRQPTGRALIAVDARGENSIIVVPGANGEVDDVELPPSTAVLCQLEIPLDTVTTVIVAARAAGSLTVLNPAPARPLPAGLVAACDVIVPNEHEIELLGGSSVLLGQGCGAVVITLGARGARIDTSDGSRTIASLAVDVVDTTGAGDAFCGSLTSRLAAGDPLEEAVRWACAAGALATTRAGAVPAQPRADDIERLLATRSSTS
ncbi:MAG: ribokinase [Ilumatobacteraceae bacterium]